MSADGRHLVLVGLMATGKTTVGALVAADLGRPLIDSDHQIERAQGVTVRDIWKRDGEEVFRMLEKQALSDALDRPDPCVIAGAGGVVLDADNRRRLRDPASVVVWLRAAPEVLAERALGDEHRPLLDDAPLERLQQMSVDRDALYREVADVTIDIGERSAGDIAMQILAALESEAPS